MVTIAVLIKNVNGDLEILTPTPRMLETRTIEEIANKDVNFGFPYWIVDITTISTDRMFRNAWEPDESVLGTPHGFGLESHEFGPPAVLVSTTPISVRGHKTNMIKANDLAKSFIREVRDPLLADLDIQYIRAQEANIPTNDIVAQKQVLRDLPSRTDNCTTEEELKQLVLDVRAGNF